MKVQSLMLFRVLSLSLYKFPLKNLESQKFVLRLFVFNYFPVLKFHKMERLL